MTKEVEIKLNIEFPEYEDMKTAIKECKRKFDKDEYEYDSDVRYDYILIDFPGGFYRIYASDDTDFKPTFDDMRGGYVHSWKLFELNKNGYKQLVEYAMDKIRTSVKVW